MLPEIRSLNWSAKQNIPWFLVWRPPYRQDILRLRELYQLPVRESFLWSLFIPPNDSKWISIISSNAFTRSLWFWFCDNVWSSAFSVLTLAPLSFHGMYENWWPMSQTLEKCFKMLFQNLLPRNGGGKMCVWRLVCVLCPFSKWSCNAICTSSCWT